MLFLFQVHLTFSGEVLRMFNFVYWSNLKILPIKCFVVLLKHIVVKIELK